MSGKSYRMRGNNDEGHDGSIDTQTDRRNADTPQALIDLSDRR